MALKQVKGCSIWPHTSKVQRRATWKYQSSPAFLAEGQSIATLLVRLAGNVGLLCCPSRPKSQSGNNYKYKYFSFLPLKTNLDIPSMPTISRKRTTDLK